MKKSQLTQIVQARMEQIFTLVRASLVKNTNNSIKELSGNIILTGGGALMEGVTQLVSHVFHTSSVRLGVPESLGGIEEDYRRPDFATVIGLVLANKSLASGKEKGRRSKVGSARKDKQKGESMLKKIFKSLF